jgi:hypothetical protein
MFFAILILSRQKYKFRNMSAIDYMLNLGLDTYTRQQLWWVFSCTILKKGRITGPNLKVVAGRNNFSPVALSSVEIE